MLNPPQLPSPAPTPDQNLQPFQPNPSTIRSDIESHLLRLSQDLYELEICAGHVGDGMEDAVPDYLVRVNQSLIELNGMASRLTDSVPRSVVENVDNHRNPHVYTKAALSRAVGENQYALGRMLGLESFRSQLHTTLHSSFPQIPLLERRHKPAWQNDPDRNPKPVEEQIKKEGDADVAADVGPGAGTGVEEEKRVANGA